MRHLSLPRSAVLVCLFVFQLLTLSVASAHEIRPALLDLTESSAATYHVQFKVPIRQGRLLAVTPAFPEQCVAGDITSRIRRFDQQITTYSLKCDRALAGDTISLVGLEQLITDVLVRLQPLEGSARILRATPDQPLVTFATNPGSFEVAGTYFVLGVEHILLGIDHLLFVLALVLLIRGVARLIWTITAFTLAHSVTLIATSLGWISLPSAPVEAVIALSIVFLASELASTRPEAERLSERVPWLVAAAFGLLHGFGFAGALAEIGLPDGDVPLALLCFNLGVEAGQLLFVALVLVILKFARPTAWWPKLQYSLTYGIGILASFWLFDRII